MATPQAPFASLAPFNPSREKWSSYMIRFRQFLRGNGYNNLDDERKRALFLAHCGSDVLELAVNLVAPRDIEVMSWVDLQTALQEHYAPTGTPISNRFTFRQRNQKEGESLKDFVAALRQIAANCEFENVDNALRDGIVFGMRDANLQKKFLSRKRLSLKDVLEEATAAETSETAAAAMLQSRGIHKIRKPSSESSDDSATPTDSEGESTVLKVSRPSRREIQKDGRRAAQCGSCKGHHPRQSCRWRDATCRRCLKKGHIAEACRASDPVPESIKPQNPENRRDSQRSSKRSSIQQNRDDRNNSHGGAVNQTTIALTSTNSATKFHVTLLAEGLPCTMEVDSGSVYSIIDWHQVKRLKPNLSKRQLEPLHSKLVDFGGNPIGVIGRTNLRIAFKHFQGQLPITVVEHSRPTLLGVEWFQPLGLSIGGIHQISSGELDSLIGEFQEVFDGKLGTFSGKPISFNLDKGVTPIRLKPRRVPFALRAKVDAQLDKLIAQGILEPIDHASWETPIVTPMKQDGSVRICADYKVTINKALPQSAYPVPVVQHLLHSLGKGKIFAKLDLAQAYQQLPVDQETAEAQTIVTHRGAFKCNRLQFGVSAAPGIFQSMMERLLQGVPGVVPYFDDVLISGDSKAQLLDRLRLVLQRFREKGLRVRRDKCIIGVQEVEFLGYLIDSSGIHPTKSKVKAIHEAPSPKNKAELQAFLGLLNFYAIFLQQKATVAEPLHRLLAKAVSWRWGREEESAFRAVKQLLTSDSVLIQYNETLPLRLTCDASPYGVGAVLSHELPTGREAPIAFFSKTMSSAERNYSQLDKEALAIVAGVKRFHEYLYGRHFTIVTDHKPLLGLLAGDKQTPAFMSPRMTRWSIFLAGYSYSLVHQPGKAIANADALSRCPSADSVEDPAPTLELLHIDNDSNCPVTSADVATHTRADPILRQVHSWVLRGWPTRIDSDDFSPFSRKQGELSTMRGCLLWGDRVLIPSTLQRRTLAALHKGHPGIVRMKALARSYVWWPTLDKDIEHWVARCSPCQEVRAAPPQSDPTPWETPSSPWSRIHIDFAGPIHGHHLLIVVDAYSKWLEVVPMASTTTEATIRALRRLFATHGLPDVLVSDNGPQLTSVPMEAFLAGLGIRHALSAPYRPAGNGQAERMVRLTKESLAKMGPGDWQERIDTFLLTQHITPHSATRKCPAELLMGRRLRSPLDRLHPQYTSEVPASASRQLRQFSVGDAVFALNFHGSPKWLKATVHSTTGPKSYRVELEDGQIVRRHLDQLRKRWREVSENHPDEVGLNHPGAVGLNHPGEVGLNHPCAVGLNHPDEVGLNHPGAVGLNHPDGAGQNHPGEVGLNHPDEGGRRPEERTNTPAPCLIPNPARQVDRGQAKQGTPKQRRVSDSRHPESQDLPANNKGQVDRGQPSRGSQHQPCEVGNRQPRDGDLQPTFQEALQQPANRAENQPCKEGLHHPGRVGQHQPDQVEQPSGQREHPPPPPDQPRREGLHHPCKVGLHHPDRADLSPLSSACGPGSKPDSTGEPGGLTQPPPPDSHPDPDRRNPIPEGTRGRPRDLPWLRSSGPVKSRDPHRRLHDPCRNEADQHRPQAEVRDPAGGSDTVPASSTARSSPAPGKKPRAEQTPSARESVHLDCELRRSTRARRRPVYLSDYFPDRLTKN